MTRVLEEAYQNVEKGLMSAEDLQDFVFLNAVRMYGTMNPDFFRGTVLESEAARLLEREGHETPRPAT